ncbi:MAG: peptidylprolyl isomerase [Eubacteriales bacterium]|nr:peptidylprolyl isomerase [Eubacteriales bacterium]
MKENILATVGEREISKEMMISIMRSMPREEVEFVAGEAGRRLLLDEMIAGELLYLDAMDNQWEKEEDFLSLLEEAKKGLLQRYAVGKLFQQIEVSEEELKAYYEEHQNEFKKEEKLSAKHILVDNLELAQKIAEEIKAGKSFEDAAQEYSSCPSKARGGDLGAFGRGQMVKEFEEAAFALERNTVSEPVKTQFGYHLIKAEDFLAASIAEFAEVKEQIRRVLAQQKQKEVYDKKLDELKDKYPVKVNAAALK